MSVSTRYQFCTRCPTVHLAGRESPFNNSLRGEFLSVRLSRDSPQLLAGVNHSSPPHSHTLHCPGTARRRAWLYLLVSPDKHTPTRGTLRLARHAGVDCRPRGDAAAAAAVAAAAAAVPALPEQAPGEALGNTSAAVCRSGFAVLRSRSLAAERESSSSLMRE